MTGEDEEFNRIEREATMRKAAVAATVAKREWAGLTDEEVYPLANEHLHYQTEGYEVSGVYDLAQAIEAKLKEKNT
jgi:uncharacterized protein YjlB